MNKILRVKCANPKCSNYFYKYDGNKISIRQKINGKFVLAYNRVTCSKKCSKEYWFYSNRTFYYKKYGKTYRQRVKQLMLHNRLIS